MQRTSSKKHENGNDTPVVQYQKAMTHHQHKIVIHDTGETTPVPLPLSKFISGASLKIKW